MVDWAMKHDATEKKQQRTTPDVPRSFCQESDPVASLTHTPAIVTDVVWRNMQLNYEEKEELVCITIKHAIF